MVSVQVVAIDGPSGTGKSTTARGVADALGRRVLDTGAMYRAVTLAVLEAGAAVDDAEEAAAVARAVSIEVEDGVTLLDGRDVSAEIRGPTVTDAVSVVAAHQPVRTILAARQRAWVDEHGEAVVEGRDIGTVVFPDAAVKVYLVASDAVRARRRHREEEVAERAVDVEAVEASLARRDRLDAGREVSPLRAADDAVVVDTSHRSVDEVVAEIVARVRALEST
jgi:cytidylate kinase